MTRIFTSFFSHFFGDFWGAAEKSEYPLARLELCHLTYCFFFLFFFLYRILHFRSILFFRLIFAYIYVYVLYTYTLLFSVFPYFYRFCLSRVRSRSAIPKVILRFFATASVKYFNVILRDTCYITYYINAATARSPLLFFALHSEIVSVILISSLTVYT